MFGQHAPAYRSAHQLQASSPRPHNLAFHNALAEGATRGESGAYPTGRLHRAGQAADAEVTSLTLRVLHPMLASHR